MYNWAGHVYQRYAGINTLRTGSDKCLADFSFQVQAPV